MSSISNPASPGHPSQVTAQSPIRAPLAGGIPWAKSLQIIRPSPALPSQPTHRFGRSPPQLSTPRAANSSASNPNEEQRISVLLLDLDLAAVARLTKENFSMTKFKPADSYEPEAVELSPNREALKSLNEARKASRETVSELQERLNRLAALKAAVAPLEAELQALDATEADALAQWSATPDAPAPESDVAARDDILVRLAGARQRIASAEQATASVAHVLDTANARAAELERSVPALVAAVLIDEARALLPGVVEATAALAKARGRYSALRKFLLERAEAAKDVAARSGFFHDLERLDKEAANASTIGTLLTFSVGTEWIELAASLGDVAARPTSTLPVAFPDMPEMKW